MRVLVVGDSILDEFCEGAVRGLSPEAPVPVLLNPASKFRLGGAINTFLNIKELRGEAKFQSIIGSDKSGSKVQSLSLGEQPFVNFTVIENYSTPHKIRFSSNGHQFLRVDRELSLDPDELSFPPEYFESVLEDALESTIIVISDYRKGAVPSKLVNEIISQSTGKTIIVDSKNPHLEIYRGASLITPNLNEGRAATGLTNPESIVSALQNHVGGSVLLTLGADGMLLSDNGARPVHVPAIAQEVSDVTGAGDSVVAGVSVALSEGASLIEAVRWAAQVSAVAVQHNGTYVVSRKEVPSWSL